MPGKVTNAMGARGRNLSVAPPGGGATTYEYAGNSVKVIEHSSLFTDYSCGAKNVHTQLRHFGILQLIP